MIEVDFIGKQRSFRKEEQIKSIITQRGNHPGIVHIYCVSINLIPTHHAKL